jgi:hypothetical protein
MARAERSEDIFRDTRFGRVRIRIPDFAESGRILR